MEKVLKMHKELLDIDAIELSDNNLSQFDSMMQGFDQFYKSSNEGCKRDSLQITQRYLNKYHK